MSFEAREARAKARLAELVEERCAYRPPTFGDQVCHPLSEYTALDQATLDVAFTYFVFDMTRIQHHPFGEFANMGQSFAALREEQQEQVALFYNRLLEANGLVLNLYTLYRRTGGYRFEIAYHPVASR